MCRAISSCWVIIFDWFYALYWKFELVVVGGFGDWCGWRKWWEVRRSWWCCQGWWWNSSRSGTLGSSNLFCSFCEGLYDFCQIAGINCIFFSCIRQIDRIGQIIACIGLQDNSRTSGLVSGQFGFITWICSNQRDLGTIQSNVHMLMKMLSVIRWWLGPRSWGSQGTQ